MSKLNSLHWFRRGGSRAPSLCGIGLLLIALVFASDASATEANASNCVDRLAAERAQSHEPAQANPIPLRLAELKYACVRLNNGRHIWVGEAGPRSAPAVLLVHGLGDNAHRDWRTVIPLLSPKFHVIAVDLPGFGASQALLQGYSFDAFANALAEVLDRYGVQRAHVVGHSLGGALSLHFAHVRSDRVDRLVLVDVAGILHRAVFVRHIAQVQLPSFGVAPADRFMSAIDRRINNLGRLLLRRLDDGFDFSGWLMENPSVRVPLLGRYTQVDAAVGLAEHNFSSAIRSVAAPTTLIWGRDDPIAPVRSGQMLAARMRDARLHVLAGVEHVPMIEATQRFNALLWPALTEPLPPKFNSSAPSIEYGDVVCVNQPNSRFSGYFATLTLKNCANAYIEFARIGKLILEGSSAAMFYSTIESESVAVLATRSRLAATAVTVRGTTALYAEQSELDFAGASIRASTRAVESTGNSRLYFSVSDIEAPDYKGDAHFIWPPATANPANAGRR